MRRTCFVCDEYLLLLGLLEMNVCRRLFLIGTRHLYQFGEDAVWAGERCSASQQNKFRNFVRQSAVDYGVKAIAEELNEEALADVGKSTSVLQSLAQDMDLPHLFCEPSVAERERLGIYDEGRIEMMARWNGWDELEVKVRVREQIEKRETFWLQRLDLVHIWPILFVCGLDHSTSFSVLLDKFGVTCNVVHANWQI